MEVVSKRKALIKIAKLHGINPAWWWSKSKIRREINFCIKKEGKNDHQ